MECIENSLYELKYRRFIVFCHSTNYFITNSTPILINFCKFLIHKVAKLEVRHIARWICRLIVGLKNKKLQNYTFNKILKGLFNDIPSLGCAIFSSLIFFEFEMPKKNFFDWISVDHQSKYMPPYFKFLV